MEPTATATAEAPPARTAVSTMLAGVLLCGAIVFLWYAPASYQVYLALHILAVTVWVGGDVTLTTLGIVFEQKLRRPDARGARARWARGSGTRVYTPTLFLVLAFGVALVQKGRLAGPVLGRLRGRRLALAILVGVGFVGPELGRIDGRRSRRAGSEEVGRRVKRLFSIFRFDTALLMLIVIDMTAKPSF